MNKTKKIALLTLGVAVGLGLAGAGYASAASDTTADTLPPIAEEIATKFNLNKTEVASYLNTLREEHQAEMDTKLEEALATAVKDGKITEDQKAKILAKHEELQAERETSTENRGQKRGSKDGLREYLVELGVDTDILPTPAGGGMGQGRGMHGQNR